MQGQRRRVEGRGDPASRHGPRRIVPTLAVENDPSSTFERFRDIRSHRRLLPGVGVDHLITVGVVEHDVVVDG